MLANHTEAETAANTFAIVDAMLNFGGSVGTPEEAEEYRKNNPDDDVTLIITGVPRTTSSFITGVPRTTSSFVKK
jgi:hypothetical protein